jgi:hypothetical protein
MQMTDKTYTFEQLIEYIRGWSWAKSDMQALTFSEVYSMLGNAASQFECDQDGFETKVRNMNKKQKNN